MKIRYLYEVTCPPDQVGKPDEEREISEYLGRKLVDTGYAVEVKPESKGKTDGSVKSKPVDSET